MTANTGRRAGRASRHAKREDMTARAGRVVTPGMTGGSFQPLSDPDIKRIHGAVLDVLANVGMADPIPEVEAMALAHGCTLSDTGRLLFPRALVEDMLNGCAKEFLLHGRDSAHDMEIGGARVHFGTAGAGVQVPDFETGRYRPSTVVDLYDFARLIDRMTNVHWFGRTVAPTELVGFEMDINKAYACAAGTTKHFGISFNDASGVAPAVDMYDMILGGEGRFAERAFCQAHTTAVVSPLRFGYDNSEVALAGLAGANLIYESAGMLASIMGCSFETVVMDNEMLGQVLRTVRGIEVSDETLSVDVIAEVAEDSGHFLGHNQTLRLMETEYLYPDLADRGPPKIWEEAGVPDMRMRARERVRELLSTHYPDYIDSKTDAAIRARYPIKLETAAMAPACGRW